MSKKKLKPKYVDGKGISFYLQPDDKNYPELEGLHALLDDMVHNKIKKLTEEEWQAAERGEISDEEIEKWVASTPYYGHCTPEYREGLEEGAKWYREQLKQKNK